MEILYYFAGAGVTGVAAGVVAVAGAAFSVGNAGAACSVGVALLGTGTIPTLPLL